MNRKTTTSTQVKQRYLDKTYTQISVRLPNDLAAEFKKACTASNTPIAAVIKQAAIDFIAKVKGQ